jgi:hypothetical protein
MKLFKRLIVWLYVRYVGTIYIPKGTRVKVTLTDAKPSSVRLFCPNPWSEEYLSDFLVSPVRTLITKLTRAQMDEMKERDLRMTPHL